MFKDHTEVEPKEEEPLQIVDHEDASSDTKGILIFTSRNEDFSAPNSPVNSKMHMTSPSDAITSVDTLQSQEKKETEQVTPEKDAVATEEFEEKFDDHLKSLETASLNHLKALVTQLLKTENLDPSWIDVITPLVLKAVNTVISHPEANDKLDIRHYIQIKRAPGGSMLDSEYVDGVVFKKNVTHKKMRSHIEKPNVLMFSCPLEHYRVENQLSSFDILIKQEYDYLKLLVSKIVEQKADLVIVEKSACRIVQQMLLQAKISLLVNVKRRVMERIARVSESKIFSSVDHADSSHYGKCEQAYTRRFAGKDGAKTLFIVKGRPDAGCTILLRGDNLDELKKVKKVTKVYNNSTIHF